MLLRVEPAASTLPQRDIPARLGIIVGKRQARHAIQRNTVKRICREAFRHCRHQLRAGDYVVRVMAKLPDDVSLTVLKRELRVEIDALLGKALAPARES